MKSIVIIGMPGSGKSSVGRRLASRLALPFFDSDTEVERAAGMEISRIFDSLGEAEFRAGEKRVVERLLSQKPCVLSTGGGTFVQENTRRLIQEKALTLGIRVEEEILFERIMRNDARPLLRGSEDEKRQKLADLLKARTPFYATADLTIDSDRSPTDQTVDRAMRALEEFSKRTI
jgi:shikimate kinase